MFYTACPALDTPVMCGAACNVFFPPGRVVTEVSSPFKATECQGADMCVKLVVRTLRCRGYCFHRTACMSAFSVSVSQKLLRRFRLNLVLGGRH